jgi:hypothetical protein
MYLAHQHNNLGEPLRPLCGLASGYPLHHLHFRRFAAFVRWFRYYPSRLTHPPTPSLRIVGRGRRDV